MFEAIIRNIKEVLSESHTVIVGLSGGADSVAMMELLSRVGQLRIIAAHCNFHLRGEESDRDQIFVETMMDTRWNTHRLEVKHFDTLSYSKEHKISIEMAARELRYSWFEELRQGYNASHIIVGHHLNDQVETVLLNLIRGTGGVGLLGMQKINGYIYRPLLETSKDEILLFLRERRLSYISDSSNEDDMFRRNYLRINVLPMLCKLNPNFYENMKQSLSHFSEEQALIDDQLKSFTQTFFSPQEQSFDLEGARKIPHYRLLMFRALQKIGFSPQIIGDILSDKERARAVFYSRNKEIVAELFRGRLYFAYQNDGISDLLPQTITLDVPCATSIGTFLWTSESRKDLHSLAFSLAHHEDSLILRYASAEDYFRPFGMQSGKKKVFTYLREKGVPQIHRSRVPILLSGEEVVAVVPFQIDDRFAIREDDTKSYTLVFTPNPPSIFDIESC
ncbi:MAG: tRNA lysidine(34) synthetase TilS [Porphyromonas sp.]|nr:tRNA lysidine(34) synthetase TilS [Porphyromonas sp.]